MSDSQWLNFLGQFGWPVAVFGFYLWRDWDREKRLQTRLDLLGDRITELQTETIRENTRALDDLKKRPCLAVLAGTADERG